MAQTRFVEPAIAAYGSRRAWRRHQRATRQRGWLHSDAQHDAPSLGVVAMASIVVLAVIVVAGLVLTQVASAIVG